MVEIKFDKESNRAIALNEEVAIGQCDFVEQGNTWDIVHTEVDASYQGQGIAKRLVECVAENAQENNKKLVAQCSYAKKIIDKRGRKN